MKAPSNRLIAGLFKHWWLIHSFRHKGEGLPSSKSKPLIVFLVLTLLISVGAHILGLLFSPSLQDMSLTEAAIITGLFHLPMFAGVHLLKAQEAFVLLWTYLELSFSGNLGLMLFLLGCPELCVATLFLAGWSLLSFLLFRSA